MKRLEKVFNPYDPTSELYALNSSDHGEPFAASRDLCSVVEKALDVCRASGRAFDPTFFVLGIDFKDGISGIDEKEAIVKKITDYLEVENYAIFEESKHLLELSRVSSSISIIDASDPVDLFICFNIIFSLVFLIAFTFIQSKQLLSLVSVELRQLGFRGCKDSLIQKSFIAEFRKVIIGSVIVGISIATFVFLHYLSLTYYALFLISAKTLQMLIFIEIFSLIISGFVVCFIALWGVSHKAKTVIEITKKEMRLYEQINRD